MKSEQESVVYNQGQGFHCAVRKFVAKLQITFPNSAVGDKIRFEAPMFDSKFSFASFFDCAKLTIGNRRLMNPMFS